MKDKCPLIMKQAMKRMLNVLDLRIRRKHINYRIPYVCENETDLVRQFIDGHGRYVELKNVPMNTCRSPAQNARFPMSGGQWTVFKNDDIATFQLFTKTIDEFSLLDKHGYSERNVKNPFFGLKSAEEVMIKCDLMDVS